MKVTVRTLEDRTIKLEVDPECTVEKFKAKIAEMNGVQPQFQRIFFAGRHLREGLTLHQNGVKEGSVIHLVIRSIGGENASWS